MPELVVIYILGFLAATSLTMAWFYSALPIHLTECLRFFGWHKNDPEFWNSIVTWQQWADAINIWHPNLLSELLTCRVCLSFHISFWIGLASMLFGATPWYYAGVTALTWPILINFTLTKLNYEH